MQPDYSRTPRPGKFLAVTTTFFVLLGCAFWGVGYQLFYRSHDSPLRAADAIIVLGGEHDGREQYGLNLARMGYAPVVVLSDPYERFEGKRPDHVMDQACRERISGVEVICFVPDPSTTLGEAMYAARLADEHGWRSLIVVSWRFHLVRAEQIFAQCFSGELIMRSVPRGYSSSPLYWGFNFAYQYLGMAKAAVLGCAPPAS